jgi:hypothetical protein
MLRRLPIFAAVLPVLGLIVGLSVTTPVMAQSNSTLDKIGERLVDDRTDMYDRYVYDNAQTVDTDVSLSLPVLPNPEVQEWLIETVAQVMSVTPTQYPMHMKKVQPYFVKNGWAQFLAQWQGAQIEELVLNRNYTMTALVMQMPTILAKGRDKGVYRWIVDVPVLLTYLSPEGQNQPYTITLRVELTRIAMLSDARLIAIDGWGLAPQDPPREDAKTR